MKVSCLPVSFFPQIISGQMSILDWARMAKECSLDAIDISAMFMKNHTPTYLNTLRRDIDSQGMPVTMVTTYPDFSHPDRTQRERELDYLRRDIAVASFLGAKYVRIVAGQSHPNTPLEEGKRWVVGLFKKAAKVGDRYGIQLVYENHSKPGAWQYSDFSFATEIFLYIVESVRDTSIRINFDTANPIAFGDDPLLVLHEIVGMVETVHAADTGERGRLRPVPLGEGLVPFKEIFRLLKQNGFDNWLCIEEASCAGERGVAKATNFIRNTWASS
jgi:sugar phosphate isomerase/epimerase